MSALLEIVEFKDFSIWDVKRHLLSLISSNYEIVRLGDYINEENKKIKPFELPNDDFKILGVSNKIGLFDNEVKKGKEINQAYKIVKDGFLAYNPYRINVGSIGLKTQAQNNDLISPAYVVFSCKKELLPEYLFLIFKTQIFNQIINESTRGSVRQILAFDILVNLKIPLPSFAEQKEMIEAYYNKINLSISQEKESVQKIDKIEKYLNNELGFIEEDEDLSNDLLKVVQFKNLNRWGLAYLKSNNNSFKSNKYPLIKISSLIKNFNGGKTPSKMNQRYWSNGTVHWASAKDFKGLELNTTIDKISDIALEETKLKLFPVGTIFMVFRSGILRHTIPISISTIETTINQDLKALSLDNSMVSNHFFVYFFNIFQERILKIISKKGATVESIETIDFLNLSIPLPSLEIQNTIVNDIQTIKNEIKELKEKAKQNKVLALSAFEKGIFSEA